MDSGCNIDSDSKGSVFITGNISDSLISSKVLSIIVVLSSFCCFDLLVLNKGFLNIFSSSITNICLSSIYI